MAIPLSPTPQSPSAWARGAGNTAAKVRVSDAAGRFVGAYVEDCLGELGGSSLICADDYGAIVGDDTKGPENLAALAAVYSAAKIFGHSQVTFARSGPYYFDPNSQIADDDIEIVGRGTVIKQTPHSTDASWLLISGVSNFGISGVIFDGNSANTPSVGADRAAVLIYGCDGITLENFVMRDAKKKGVVASSGSSGAGAANVTVMFGDISACGAQALMCDGTTGGPIGAPPCENINFSFNYVHDTSHAGIVANDGARQVRIVGNHVDLNSSVFDAISLRGSQQVTVTSNVCRRSRNGIYGFVTDAAALARGEESKGLTLGNNICEYNYQNGISILGVVGGSSTGDICRNNGQLGAGYSGLIVSQIAGVRRTSNFSVIGPSCYDDQSVPTQSYGVSTSACDNVKVISPIMWGNITKNYVNATSGVTGFEVIGDGNDGATRKNFTATTGTVPASSYTTITCTFATPFFAAPNYAQASVFVGSATPYMRVEQIVALTTNAIQVMVRNDHASLSVTGVLHLEVACLT